MIGVQKGKSSIWQAVNSSLWKKKTNLLFLSIVRGSMAWGNLHHKNSHNIENYLQWEKKYFFFFFFLSVGSTVWIVSLNESVYAERPFLDSFFSLLWKQLEVHDGSLSLLGSSPFRRPQRALFPHDVQKFKRQRRYPHRVEDVLTSFLVFFFFVLCFFFFALLKGSFPTQFF